LRFERDPTVNPSRGSRDSPDAALVLLFRYSRHGFDHRMGGVNRFDVWLYGIATDATSL
jgi:hypothetical protein